MPDPTKTPDPAPAKPADPPAQTPQQAHNALVGYDELDSMDAAPAKEGAKPNPPTPAPTAAAVPAPTAGAKPADDGSTKTDSGGAPTATGSTDKPPEPEKPVKAAELRAAYEKLKKEHGTLKAEHEKLKTAKPPEDTDRKTLVETLDARDKRIKELEQELSFTAYERSQDYKDKYEKPFVDAYNAGRARLAALKVVERRDEAEQVTQQARQGTAADFDKIMAIVDDEEAAQLAEQMFGSKNSMVLYHRERVQELNRQRLEAVESHKKGAEEREKQAVETRAKEQEETKTRQARMVQMFNEQSTAAVEKYPQFFKPTDGDDKGNALLESGRKFADMVFKPTSPYSAEQAVAIHAAAYNKLLGFDRLAYLWRKEQARVKELETKLAEFTKSEGAGGATHRPPAEGEKSFDQELEELDKTA